MISSPQSTYSSSSTSTSIHSPTSTNINIPLPPSSTIETSDEPPRTLWMGDLDPNFDDLTIMEIWHHLGKKVVVKLIKAKKNLLIPCSSNNNNSNNNGSNLSDSVFDTFDSANIEKININGISFIDPSVTPLHHAGYCFVEFESQNDAIYALSLNSKPIPNFKSLSTNLWTNPTNKRTFRLNWASGATLNSSIPLKPEFSLFVGDLSPTVTEADLLTLFQKKFKSVKTVRVMTDPMTGASRCFGFIRFGDELERSKAVIEMNGIWFQGRALRVAFATPRNSGVTPLSSGPFCMGQQTSHLFNSTVNNNNATSSIVNSNSFPNKNIIPKNNPLVSSYSNNNNNNNNNNNTNFMSANGAANYSIPSPSSDIQDFQYITNDPTNTTIFVGGLNSSNISEYKLISLFQPFGNVVSVKIPLNKNCAFVKFQNRIDSEAAMQGMQGFVIDGSPIRLSWGKTNTNTHIPQVTTATATVTNNGATTIPISMAHSNRFISNCTNIQQQSDLLPTFNGSMWSDSVNNINYANSNQLFQGVSGYSNELFNTDNSNNYNYQNHPNTNVNTNTNANQCYGLSSSNQQTDTLYGIHPTLTNTMAPKINSLYYENKSSLLNKQFQPNFSSEINYHSYLNQANQDLQHYNTIFH